LYADSLFILIYFSYIAYFLTNLPNKLWVIYSGTGIIIFLVFVLIQEIFNFILKNHDSRAGRFTYLFLACSLFIFLNLNYLTLFVQQHLNEWLNISIRHRHIFLFYSGLTVFVALQHKRFVLIQKVFKIVLIAENLLFIPYKGLAFTEPQRESPSGLKSFHSSKNPGRIIFIIMDEYSPADVMYKMSGDSSVFGFEHDLKNKDFIVRNNIQSQERSTVRSICRIFNQNAGLSFKDSMTENRVAELKDAYLIKVMEAKNYQFKNYSFFNVGGYREYGILGLYTRNNLDIITQFTMYQVLLPVIPNLTLSNIFRTKDFYTTSQYNNGIEYESLKYLNESKENKAFLYVHFLMPHGPYIIEGEFPFRNKTLKNYIAYWKFTNSKIMHYIQSIPKDCKIIVSGDHGYNESPLINPYLTSSAFYKFDSSEVNAISCVQDIGKLLLNQ